METNILGISPPEDGQGFPFSSAVSFGEISNSARRRNSKSKLIHCLGQIIPYLYFSDYAKLRTAPSALASGISARATSA